MLRRDRLGATVASTCPLHELCSMQRSHTSYSHPASPKSHTPNNGDVGSSLYYRQSFRSPSTSASLRLCLCLCFSSKREAFMTASGGRGRGGGTVANPRSVSLAQGALFYCFPLHGFGWSMFDAYLAKLALGRMLGYALLWFLCDVICSCL